MINPCFKKIRLTACLLAGFLTVPVLSDDKVDISKLPPASDEKVDFVKDIKPVLEKSCFKCHGGGRRPKAKYSVESREMLIKGGSSEEISVVVGKSAESKFIHYVADLVEEYEMPPVDDRDTFPKLTAKQISQMRAWIDQGAKWPEGVKLVLPEK